MIDEANRPNQDVQSEDTTALSRRSFIAGAGAVVAAAPFFVRNMLSAPPNSIVRLGAFGAENMAFWTISNLVSHKSVRLIAVAEIDTANLSHLKSAFPDLQMRVYQDWRRMLDKEQKNLDAVCVGTPDHMHAPMSMKPMQLGLHVYVQKPLTHNLYEARKVTEFARRRGLITQMGIQRHSGPEYRTAVELIRRGAIGKVKEVHSWSNKKWGDPKPLPERNDPVPSTLDWDGWLGVAAQRPYLDGYYHPHNWRARLDFGTANLGDMGCHILDPVFSSIGLTAPLSVRSEGPEPNRDSWAENAVVRYVFPGTLLTEEKTLKVMWYDGDQKPPAEVQALLEGQKLPDQGSIIIGTKGVMLLPHPKPPVLHPISQFKGYAMPRIENIADHYHEFVDTILGKTKTSAPFDYSGPLTEAVLLGGVAARFPQTTLQWNTAKLKFTNVREANAYIRRHYRKGWEVKGL